MSSRIWLLIPMLAGLAGCPVDIKPTPPAPTVVIKEVDKYVRIDSSLLKDCPIAEPADRTVASAVNVANKRKEALQSCNIDKANLRAIQPAPATSAP